MTDARALAGHLRLHPGRRDGPAISGGRPDWLVRLAPGRDADTLPTLLGALFSLCADAHRDCARAALRAARGQTESAAEAAVAAQALRLGTACGSATAFSLGLATKEKIDELLAQL